MQSNQNYRWFTLVAALVLCGLLAPQIRSQVAATPQVRVGIADPAKIIQALRETVDVKMKMDSEGKTLNAEAAKRDQEVRDLQSARDLLKPDSAQWAAANKQWVEKTIDYQVWGQIHHAEQAEDTKRTLKRLYDKIKAATAKVAVQNGFDLVLTEMRDEKIDGDIDKPNVSSEDVTARLARQNILYNAETVNLTDKIIAAMDAEYTGKK